MCPSRLTLRWPSSKKGNRSGGKGPKAGRSTVSNERPDMPLGGAVNPCVRHVLLPVMEVVILRLQRIKGAASQGIALDIAHTSFHLAFVTWGARTCRKKRDVVVPAEVDDLRIQFGVVPIRLRHGRLGVVKHDDFGHAPQRSKGILQRTNERLRGELSDGFGVALCGNG